MLVGSWCGGFRVLGVRQVNGRVALGLHGSQTGSCILLRLQMRFRSGNRRLRGIIFRRRAAGCAGGRGGNNRLPSVAHFLYGRPRSATQQTGNTDQNNKEARHRVARH